MPIVIDPGQTNQPGSFLLDGRLDAPRATWTDPSGAVWNLSDFGVNGIITNARPVNTGAIPRTFVADNLPQGGSKPRHVQKGPRHIGWPVYVGADDAMTYRQKVRALTKAFTMSADLLVPGVLTVYFTDGSALQIKGIYEGGMEGDQAGSLDGVHSDAFVVGLYCGDPHWTDTVPGKAIFEVGLQNDFLAPFPTVSSSQVLGTASNVNNTGEADAYPVWDFTGPWSTITARNNTTGKSFTYSLAAAAGGTLHMVTQAEYFEVTDGSGNDRSSYLNWPTTSLWPLVPGVNSVTVTVAGAGNGSRAVMSWVRRFESM